MKNQRTMQLAAAVSAGALSLSLAAAPLPAAAAAPLHNKIVYNCKTKVAGAELCSARMCFFCN